ncbi:MAG: CHASE domain-containing protein [Pseudomonadota bacterium]
MISLSLLMTALAYKHSVDQVTNRNFARFETERDQLMALLVQGMQTYEDGLRAAAAAIQSHGGAMTRDQWHDFVTNLGIRERLPGVNGLAYIDYVPEARRAAYLTARRLERPEFAIYPETEHPFSLVVSFIEPLAPNQVALGLDIAAKPERRLGLIAARDTGAATLSYPLTLVQDTERSPGFVLQVPFYATGMPATRAGLEAAFSGIIAAPFVFKNIMEGLLAHDQRAVNVQISDGEQVVFDELTADAESLDPAPLFAQRVVLQMYGREWVLDVRSNLKFRAANGSQQPLIVLAAGLIIEALIIALIVMLARANARAVAYADRITKDLKDNSRTLKFRNSQIEQFAYVASHDLKTPIRGISALTEMIREDLTESPKGARLDPLVFENLDRITERTERMDALIHSILEFSRAGEGTHEAPPLSMAALVEDMTTDFGLLPGQIRLVSDIKMVAVDGYNFQRVVENLVGNAIKYHKGKDPLEIHLTLRQERRRLSVEVADNGPGIDPKYHERVFEVFQTLRAADAPQSSGIGLAIVRKIVEMHGGRTWLVSSEGAGATFGFDWPVESAGKRPAAANGTEPLSGRAA